MQLGESDQAGR